MKPERIYNGESVQINFPIPNVPYEEHMMTTYTGESYPVYVTQEETSFPDGSLITSRTDINGVITHANEAFVTMSGWSRDELIGAPHSILRHPDMPKVAFKGLWETLQRGEKWHGYVKNLRKDGGYYWVYATAIPNIRNGVVEGYTSVRRKPSLEKIKECTELYAQLLKAECAESD
ncbi:PAS domain-containing protein [Kingella negevensis]|uniref:Aerotaxis receptor n=1 Tax=Kingella negevensis TaxID=1522312 RepID=A0A238T883_9NEIS|nr:PAS domain-containing protein [Kingella negevensis]MDK4679331.1 PAS domain-containing protein [Kingella negevensis]MDK4682948.1 PAS domain-containing protein [Kingella negevensis]MDK4685154.1 PAS domain-containing protein [Kingella negevensis]MDK4691148.1 PAS domain-containing protein [Kingella negevensis]MDK4693704.1 PAS domain-containing protein [Kingella negevensis]